MVTFFVIFIVLIALNAALLITSSISARSAATGAAKSTPAANEIKIYPIDLLPSDYKKAI
jgi:hypothetical protein